MATIAGDIDTLSRAILAEARVESDELRAAAQAAADAIRVTAEQDAARAREAILAQARQDVERLRGQSQATAQLDARARGLEHREKLLQQVFDRAAAQLPQVVRRSDYQNVAGRLLREAVSQLYVREAVVRADPSTQKTLTKEALAQVSSELGVELSVGAPLEKGTGVVVETPDGHLHFDNTLENRLARMRAPLRAAVYHVLMGELHE